ncbi:MAG: NAD(P)H-binding protein [Archangium sp.]|nr:NAD(P)H-binding protein [Archangium sp.]
MGARAIVIGSTGLVGKQLVEQLLEDARFDKVVSFARRATGKTHAKLEEHLVDFKTPDAWADKVQGDVLFSALGTTLKQAGSKEAQYEVDYTFQFNTAKAAAKNGVKDYVLVSSASASASSMLFYSRIKGELERDTEKLGFTCMTYVRPGLLGGDREKPRAGERFAEGVLDVIGWLPGLGNAKTIQGKTVAKAMIAAWNQHTPGVTVLHNKQLFVLGA